MFDTNMCFLVIINKKQILMCIAGEIYHTCYAILFFVLYKNIKINIQFNIFNFTFWISNDVCMYDDDDDIYHKWKINMNELIWELYV